MEFVEHLFKKLWKTEKQKSETSVSCVFYEEHALFFESLVKLCLGSNHNVLIRPVDSLCGCSRHIIYLPTSLNIHSSYESNYRLYIYLVIKVIGAHFVRSKREVPNHPSLLAQTLETLKVMGSINSWIDKEFPEFRQMETEVEEKLDSLVVRKDEIYNLWSQCRSTRGALSHDSNRKIDSLFSHQKRNDELPAYLFSTVPLFLEEDESSASSNEKASLLSKNETEIKKKRNKIKPVKMTKLDDKEVNPVIHSFEKLETLDKYEGGRRFDSGEDELAKHESALEEVDLSQVTTDGESTNSVYSVDDYGLRALQENGEASSTAPQVLLFDEWDYRSNSYRKKYCTLNVQQNKIKTNLEDFREKIRLYSKFIEKNRKKIIFFKNDPQWQSRLSEGDDIDTSQWARVFADLKAGHTPTYDIFTRKVKKERNVAVFFLFDQSLSTDSWIDNQKIINVIKDSLLIAGESLKDVINEVSVASTYSVSRKNCVVNIHKSWDALWTESYGPIFSAEPTGYTRLGPGVRYAIQELQKRKSKKKILYIITDGKVSDIDPYEGRYGLYDIKKALSEAERLNIKTVGVTLDRDIKSYFRIMFGKYRNMKSARDFSDILIQSLYSVLR